MLFIEYSCKDRYTIVEQILFHLQHFGLNVWYDFQGMFPCDDRFQTNFVHHIGSSTYIVFIISSNLFSSACAMEELAFAKNWWSKAVRFYSQPFTSLLQANCQRNYVGYIM